MNRLCAEKLERISTEISQLTDFPERLKASSAIKAIVNHLRNPVEELCIYTEDDLDLALYRARAEDISKNKELTIRLEEARREIQAIQSRSNHFEAQSNDYLRCLKQYQADIGSLTLTVHKHQKNFEVTAAENAKLKTEIQELKILNTTMADSISQDRHISTVENATMRAELDSLQRSTSDYKAAFVSTKKKLQLAHQRHQNLLGMTELQSPMGQELDSTTISWTEEGLSAQQPFGYLLSLDGTSRTHPIAAAIPAKTSTLSELNFDLKDLSDAACLV